MPSSRLALAIILALPAVLPRPVRADTRLEMRRAMMFTDTLDGADGLRGGSVAPSNATESIAHAPIVSAKASVAPGPVAIPRADTTAAAKATAAPGSPAAKKHPAGASRAPVAIKRTTPRAAHAHRATPSSADVELVAQLRKEMEARDAELRKELQARDAQIAALREELKASRAAATVQLVPVVRGATPAAVKEDPTAIALSASRLNREALQAVSTGDYRVAVDKFRRAADLNDPAAMANLGTMYLNGTGVPQDASHALQLLVQAANKGNRTAAENLGTLCEYGISGVARNPVRAYQWYEVAARLGSTTVQTSMARIRGRD